MTNPSSTLDQRRGVRIAARALITTATAAALFGLAGVSASADVGDVSGDTVVATVNVDSTISLSLDQGDFELNGTPDSTVAQTGAVTGTVTTNNATGYSVGVVADAATLEPTLSGNANTIPIDALSVHNVAGTYIPLSADAAEAVITATKTTRSALTGDDFSDDYSIDIPGVNSDTYTVTLNYTATAL